ncbi:hypothetical protein [Mariniphaga sp.]|uniref:hypothetical protein n=1 Tax=Mariniphaga sp. TaxID=1954475 RepID=UPI0035612FAA
MEKPLPGAEYPTIYQKVLSQQDWNAKNTAFQQTNVHENLSLNQQGFLEGQLSYEADSLTLETVVQEVQELISRYSIYMGIPAGQTFDLENELVTHSPLLIPDGSTSISNYFSIIEVIKETDDWEYFKDEFRNPQIYLKQKTIEGQQFLGPDLIFDFDETNRVIKISGNWLPKAFKPENEIYSKTDATAITYRILLDETGKDFWERKHTWNFRKVFILAADNEENRICECWQLVTMISDRELFYIYIDTQTGEIIRQYRRWVMF